jgi:hypothetical protein
MGANDRDAAMVCMAASLEVDSNDLTRTVSHNPAQVIQDTNRKSPTAIERCLSMFVVAILID